MSKNIWFIAGTVLIVFVGTFIEQPAVIQWLGRHPIYDALITSLGIAFHALNTYLPKPQPAQPPAVPNVAVKAN
jgi:hypothetical protein